MKLSGRRRERRTGRGGGLDRLNRASGPGAAQLLFIAMV
ncbi:hypothetical protein LG3211_2936 [Lysobacter gummosus]|nr:hypothetical protein LG3211_2936 [Lysobacter gummosus]